MVIKAQVLADFIAECTYDVAPNPEIGGPVEQNQNNDVSRWKLFIDVVKAISG